MKLIHRIILWTVLVAVALLTGLSIVGAFIGVDNARQLFNSTPIVAFWFLLLGSFVCGFFVFKRLRRSPGLLALHLGATLILAGAMYGSEAGHAFARKHLQIDKIPSGFMKIEEGRITGAVLDGDGREIGNLNFNIGLKDFWLEYYDEPGDWLLGIDAPAGAGHARDQEVIDWQVGQELEIPFAGVTVKILQYLEKARPVYDEENAGVLLIVRPDGETTSIPAVIGQETTVEVPEGTLRVVEIFSHLIVSNGEVKNLTGSNGNPALKVEFEQPDGSKSNYYAYAKHFQHQDERSQLQLKYKPRDIVAAEVDPNSSVPAMEILLSYGDKQARKWLVATSQKSYVELPLTELLGLESPGPDAHGHVQGGAILVMAKRHGQIKDYLSRLAVIEEGKEVLEQVIEVNKPLHYGDYHFYQYSYDDEQGNFTVLSVKSDSGLWEVYAGFILLGSGAFVLQWLLPAWNYLKKRRDNVS